MQLSQLMDFAASSTFREEEKHPVMRREYESEDTVAQSRTGKSVMSSLISLPIYVQYVHVLYSTPYYSTVCTAFTFRFRIPGILSYPLSFKGKKGTLG